MAQLNEPMDEKTKARLTPIAEKIAANGDCSEEILDLIGPVALCELHYLFQLVTDISRTKGL